MKLRSLYMAVRTNVGVAHIEFYGSQEAICHEKYTISKGFGKEGLLIVNGDDELLYKFKRVYRLSLCFVRNKRVL